MSETLKSMGETMRCLKNEIIADDKQYLDYCKEVKIEQILAEKQHKQDLILFSQAKAIKDADMV